MMRVDLSNRTSHFLEASGVPWPPYQRDFIEFPIDVSDLGDVMEARTMRKQVPKACVSFRGC